jgi:hypothetical protein
MLTQYCAASCSTVSAYAHSDEGRRETLHPETKHGAVGRGGKKRSQNEISFIDDTARKTGRGRAPFGLLAVFVGFKFTNRW